MIVGRRVGRTCLNKNEGTQSQEEEAQEADGWRWEGHEVLLFLLFLLLLRAGARVEEG